MGKLFLLSLLLFSYSSCTDQGCIEADDFGEYQQQILTVKANNVDENCNYDSTKSLDDATQGAGIKVCLTSGNVSIDPDGTGVRVSTTGCAGFTDVVTRNLCIEQCRQDCITGGSANSDQAEPDWVPTSAKKSGQNSGVTLTPGAEIEIRVVGNVTLGADQSTPPVFARSSAVDYGLQSKKNDFTDSFIDVKANTTKDVKFSGKWTDAIDSDNSSSTTVGGDVSSTNITEQQAAFNGGRRLAAFLIPHPSGYSFDNNATSEKVGTKGTPLFADTDLWTCSYDNTDDIKQKICSSLPYDHTTGYLDSSNTATTSLLYSITSSSQGNNLGTIGGAIRWNSDGLEAFGTDPFVSAFCNPTCSNIPSNTSVGGILNSGGSNLGNPSNPVILRNDNNYAVRISFKNLSTNDGGVCNLSGANALSVTIKDKDGVTISQNSISVNKTDWNTNYIALEPGDNMTFALNTTNYSGTSCGNVIAFRINKLQDILINQSGFVSFTSLAGSGNSGSCSLKGRIINPSGLRTDDAANNFDNDFYEYDSFSTPVASSVDPLRNLGVPVSGAAFQGTPFAKTWSNKVFVRKGQVIRLDPTSWDGSWDPGTGHLRQCGIGMVMKIDQRPAFLCRGVATDQVPNPLCNLATDDSGNLTCSNSGALPTTSMDLTQCYNLENYTGKVSNINSTTGFTQTQLDDPASSKGAVKLTTFDGVYGNFDKFSNTGTSEPAFNNNNIYSLPMPVIFKNDGRLKFLILDGNDFNNNMISSYSGNGSSSGTYSGLNGYKIDISGKQEFKNGEWLEAILCQESSDSSHDCSTSPPNVPQDVSGQPFVVKLADPAFPGDGARSITYYQFDNFGSIVRFANPDATGPYPPTQSIADVPLNSNFYKHSYQYYPDYKGMTKSQIDDINSKISRLRLSFKIKDPEFGNCIIASPALGQDCTGNVCDGIVSENRFYDSTVASNIGTICTTTPGSETGKCKKQFFCANKYYNNSGSYQVLVKVKNEQSNISDIVNQVVSPVIEIMDGKQDPSHLIKDCKTSNPQMHQNCFNNICDGLVSHNPFYYPDDPLNANAICGNQDLTPGSSDGQCKKEYYCASQAEATMGQAERVYKAIIANPKFKAMVEIVIILMISFYGVGYLMGVSEFSQGEIVSRIIKIAVVYLFVSPEGWDWFNQIFVHFFKNGTDYVTFVMASAFDRSAELQNAINNGDFHDKSILFSGIDRVFGMFFSSAVQKKISALLFASIFGWAYLYLIYLGFMLYVYAVANAVLLYLTAQVFISILFVLGPLFFLTLLFTQTKDMFDKWLSELISFSLQQVFLLITLAFFNMMMYEVIKMSLGYRICWDDVWVINIYITRIKLLSFWTVASLPPRLNPQSDVGNIGNPEGIPSIFSILFIWVIASLMNKFIGFMTDLAATLAGGVKASAMAQGVSGAAKGISGQMANYRRQYFDKHARSALQSVDRALFDSGAKADADRKKAEDTKKTEKSHHSELIKAREAGESEFRIKNAAALKGMDKAEQNRRISAAGQQALQDKAEKLGIKKEDVDRIAKGKFGITSGTITGAALEVLKDQSSKLKIQDKIKDKALGRDKSDRTALTGAEFKAALAKADDKQKAELLAGVESGDLSVKADRLERAKSAMTEKAKDAKDATKQAILHPINTASAAWKGIKNTPNALKAMPGKIKESLQNAQKTATEAKVKDKKDKTKDKSAEEQAREELEKAGKIAKMAVGTKWAASDEDKKLIAAKAEEIKQKQKDQQLINTKKGNTTANINFATRAAGLAATKTPKPTTAGNNEVGQATQTDDETTDEETLAPDQPGNPFAPPALPPRGKPVRPPRALKAPQSLSHDTPTIQEETGEDLEEAEESPIEVENEAPAAPVTPASVKPSTVQPTKKPPLQTIHEEDDAGSDISDTEDSDDDKK